jgi:hypothetical protein
MLAVSSCTAAEFACFAPRRQPKESSPRSWPETNLTAEHGTEKMRAIIFLVIGRRCQALTVQWIVNGRVVSAL